MKKYATPWEKPYPFKPDYFWRKSPNVGGVLISITPIRRRDEPDFGVWLISLCEDPDFKLENRESFHVTTLRSDVARRAADNILKERGYIFIAHNLVHWV